MRKHHRFAWLFGGWFLVLVAVPVPWASAVERPVAGQVVDAEGAGIEGATIYLAPLRAPAAAAIAPVARAASPGGSDILVLRSVEDGTFSGAVPPGRYRVAASKPGYDLLLTEVNLRARRLLELRLRQAARRILGDRPYAAGAGDDDLDWILRRPADDVLRDREAAVLVPEADGGEVAAGDRGGRALVARTPDAARWLERLMRPLDGEITHLVSGGDPFGEGPAPGDTDGFATRLALKGAFSEGGSWRFDGRMGRSAAGFAVGRARQGRRSDRVMLGMEHALGPGGRLQAEVDYGLVRFVREAGGPAPYEADQAQRTTAVRSRWDRRLGADALMYVDGVFRLAGVSAPAARASADFMPAETGDGSRARDRSWRAGAGIALEVENHRVDLGLRTGAYRHDLLNRGFLLAGSPETPALAEPGDRGSAVSLFGQDDWRVAGRYVVNYGLGYHNLLGERSGFLVPRVGVTREPGRPGGAKVRSMLLFRVDDPPGAGRGPSAATSEYPGRGEADRVGYLIVVESGPVGKTRVAAAVSYRPFEEMADDPRGETLPGSGAAGPIVLTDGAAGRHEVGLEVQRGFGDLHGSISGSIGRVEGRLAPAIEESPVPALRFGEARYYLTSVRALYAPTETEVQIDFRRVMGELEAGSEQPDAVEYRRVDLTVQQELPRFNQGARWKVLMAYQGLLSGQADAGSGGEGPLTASRLSGGVEISF
jgi:hypothetical protein